MDPLESASTFNGWLKLRRKLLDLTQAELAGRVGCSVFALRKIESGERRPSKQLAGLLAEALELPPGDRAAFVRVARGELNLERLRMPALPLPTGTGPSTTIPHNLPNQSGSLIGRSAELAALERIFTDPQCRLMTLTGLGGIGKTSLAVSFGATRLGLFPGGVYFVSLAPLDAPDLIVPAIADAFGLAFSGPSDPREQLINALDARSVWPLLLILDNLEHLIGVDGGAVGLVKELLERLPGVKILATSRERLNLHGEWMFELHGLTIPPADALGDLEEFGAVQLFVLGARKVRPDFAIGAGDRAALIRICHLLEGIPLAIEMAAAWAGMLSCAEIAGEIAASLDFLTTAMRDVPERHRSIRATFDHSWKLLPEDECSILQRLSVFSGGFSRQAAEVVAGARLPELASLHAKSLILRAEDGRYELHEVIRQYAQAHLERDPRSAEIRDRHGAYYLGLVQERERALKSADQKEAIHELTVEKENIRAAWAWALRRGELGWIGGAARSYGWMCDIAGWLQEGIEQMELAIQALRAGEADAERGRILGNVLAQQGLLHFRRGSFDRARARWEESLAILRPFGDPDLLAIPLVYYGILLLLLGDFTQARSYLDESLICTRAVGDGWFEAYALFNQGYIESLQGRYAAGYEQMQVGLARWREHGDPSSIALGLNYISPTAIQLGRLDEAQAYLEEGLALCTQVGDRWGMGTAYRNLGLTALMRGDADAAQALLRQSLEIFGEHIIGWDIARSIIYLGDAAVLKGDLAGARGHYLEGLRLATEVDSTPLALEALVGLARGELGAGRPQPALEIARAVAGHPAATQVTKDACNRLAAEIGIERSAQGPPPALEPWLERFLAQARDAGLRRLE